MKVLVTNDDGVDSPGLWAVVDSLKDIADLFVVAPDREQSGVGTSLTLNGPLRTRTVRPPGPGHDQISATAVEGTPGDCCVLALEHLVGPVDLVISGINQGSNLGEDILISGTVGAALQGYVRGYPSVAISVGAVKNARFDVAAAFIGYLGRSLADGVKLPPSLLNINIPNEPPAKIQGVQVTRLGRRSYGESVNEREDGRHKYYWISRNKAIPQQQAEDTDIWAVRHNRISVTPVYTQLTDGDRIPEIEGIFQRFSPESSAHEGPEVGGNSTPPA